MNPRTRTIGLRDRGMLAGEAAKVLGVGIQTLHFYEQQGLIPPPPRSEGGYRIYTPEIIERVRFIRKAQALGFSLDEVKEIFGLVRRGSSPCGRVQTKLAEKLEEVDRRLEELRGFRAELASLVNQAAELCRREAVNPPRKNEVSSLWVPQRLLNPLLASGAKNLPKYRAAGASARISADCIVRYAPARSKGRSRAVPASIRSRSASPMNRR